VAGWFLTRLSRVPEEGAMIKYSGWVFEIVDMDSNRVDKVLASTEEVEADTVAEGETVQQED
jgi:CBS domain containing-hemolysin-like protein